MKTLLTLSLMITTIFSFNTVVAQQQEADPDPAYYSTEPEGRDYRMAVGLRLSNSIPTMSSGITGKYFITNRSAIEGIVSWGGRFGFGGLLEVYQPFNTNGLSWFYGAGAYVGFQSDADKNGNGKGRAYAGPTGVLGVDYKFANAPINVSLDWKPELDVIPAINFVPDAFALSVRFAFGR